MAERTLRMQQLVSAAAVVLSLIFVGVEVRQNTRATRGGTMQAISDASSEYMTAMALDPAFVTLIARVNEGATDADFEPEERLQLSMSMFAFLRMLENTYLQHREGVVGDAVFESYGWHDGIIRTAYFAGFWERAAPRVVSPEFRRFFEARVQIGP